ncbi:MAG TPA: tRNA epoxyqueuosine(34) reductase QueG [Thermoanaerobaculia bacterium]|nr:tRNA epoxyqueuosine(34) reductase QueG [Thermoanaerobaculia bacterium]
MTPTLSSVWPEVSAASARLGVLRIGGAPIDPPSADLFERWLARGHHGTMSYLAKNAAVRRNPTGRFPWAKSVIMILVPYESERSSEPGVLSSAIARYALGDDYHIVLDGMLVELEGTISRLVPEAQTRRYVDTGPLSDRAYAAAAGLGWIGKNGMLIDPDHGSYFFIGTLLTSLRHDLNAEEITDRCGTCRHCIEACPTDAIAMDRTIDSTRCISYATIEHRGPLPVEVRDKLSGNVFGCDICQEVCPWNHTPAAPHPSFRLRESYRNRPVSDLLQMKQADFSSLFSKSAVKRAKRSGMVRNALTILSDTVTPPELSVETDEGIRDALQRGKR